MAHPAGPIPSAVSMEAMVNSVAETELKIFTVAQMEPITLGVVCESIS